MPTNLISKTIIKELAAKASGLDNDQGNARHKEIVNRLLHDLMIALDELDISMDEFRAEAGYPGEAAKANELGLVVPGIALEHFFDLRLDEAERRAGVTGGTTRTIEGPLYVHRFRLPDHPRGGGGASDGGSPRACRGGLKQDA